MTCPYCGSHDVAVQVFQENRGSRSVSRTRNTYHERGHGCLWWLIIGWWWWAVDLLIWFVAFVPRAIFHILYHVGRRRRYVGRGKTVTRTHNDIGYAKMCVCQDCGHSWQRY